MIAPGQDIAALEVAGLRVSVFHSVASDGALVVQIDTSFEPNGSDGGPGLRVRVNEADVTECGSADFIALGEEDQ